MSQAQARASHPHTVTTNNSEARMDKRMDVFLGSGQLLAAWCRPHPEGQGSAERAWTQHGQAGSSPWLAEEETGALPASLLMKLTGVKMATQGENLAGQGHFRVLPFSLISNGLHAGGGKGHGGTTLKG